MDCYGIFLTGCFLLLIFGSDLNHYVDCGYVLIHITELLDCVGVVLPLFECLSWSFLLLRIENSIFGY